MLTANRDLHLCNDKCLHVYVLYHSMGPFIDPQKINPALFYLSDWNQVQEDKLCFKELVSLNKCKSILNYMVMDLPD